jgi:hypothetical protein
MKTSIARILMAAIAGILMIKYRENMVHWLTILIGAMFFLWGVISTVNYFVMNNKRQKALLMQSSDDAENASAPLRKPALPIAGIGCAILGAILALMPDTFIDYTVSIFAALIIWGALSEYAALIAERNSIREFEDRTATAVGVRHEAIYWIIPTLLLIFGVVAIVWRKSIASAPFLFLGIAMIVYAVGTLVNTVKLRIVRRRLNRTQQPHEEVAEAVEVTEEDASV